MKCRHCKTEWKYDWEYCPECNRNYGGAVYPDKQTREELSDIDTLIEMIHNAFAGVKLEEGTTIHEAELEGAYDKDEIRWNARGKDQENDWRDVPAWKIEQFHSAIRFFDAKGWRFYIPAYMSWTLKNWRTSNSQTVDSVIWSFEPLEEYLIHRFNTLSNEQGASIYAFLDFFRRYTDQPETNYAIEIYWRRYQKFDS